MICNLTVSLLGHGRVLQICVSVICDPSTLHSRPPFCGAGLLHKRLLLWSWSIFPHVTGQGLHRLQLPHEPSITRKIIGLIIPAHKQSLVIASHIFSMYFQNRRYLYKYRMFGGSWLSSIRLCKSSHQMYNPVENNELQNHHHQGNNWSIHHNHHTCLYNL